MQVAMNMKKIAIAANGFQLIIILVILFIKGFQLGAVVIFLLFLLITVPFINLLMLLFYENKPIDYRFENNENQTLVKRKSLRVTYRSGKRPVLTIKKQHYEVLDISEGGVRILLNAPQPLKKRVKAEIKMLTGEQVRFKGVVKRRENSEAAVIFTTPLDASVILAEKKHIDTHPGQA